MRVYSDDIKYEDLKSLKQYLRSLKDKKEISKMSETRIIEEFSLNASIIPTIPIPKKEQSVWLSGEWIENDYIIVDYCDKSGNNYIKVISEIDNKPYELQRFFRLRSLRSLLGSTVLLGSEDGKVIYGQCDKEHKVSKVPIYHNPRGFTSYIGKIRFDVDAIGVGNVVITLEYKDWYLGDTKKQFVLSSGTFISEDVIKIAPNSEVKIDKSYSNLNGFITVEIIMVETYGSK